MTPADLVAVVLALVLVAFVVTEVYLLRFRQTSISEIVKARIHREPHLGILFGAVTGWFLCHFGGG